MNITRKHFAKMEGMWSINTSTKMNDFCKRMAKTNTVCAECYAARLESFRGDQELGYCKSWYENGLELSSGPLERVPRFNTAKAKAIRFHAFGELINRMHLDNFKRIAERNPKIIFTLWTKRKNLVRGFVKPSNMILIFSEYKVNRVRTVAPENFDKTFVVFNKKFVKENNIEINCGQKCVTCMKCYSHNNIQVINELMKREKSA
jgi:hypothetical protein